MAFRHRDSERAGDNKGKVEDQGLATSPVYRSALPTHGRLDEQRQALLRHLANRKGSQGMATHPSHTEDQRDCLRGGEMPLEIGYFVVERKMLLGIKGRAENDSNSVSIKPYDSQFATQRVF